MVQLRAFFPELVPHCNQLYTHLAGGQTNIKKRPTM